MVNTKSSESYNLEKSNEKPEKLAPKSGRPARVVESRRSGLRKSLFSGSTKHWCIHPALAGVHSVSPTGSFQGRLALAQCRVPSHKPL